jgi:hypothetical protein
MKLKKHDKKPQYRCSNQKSHRYTFAISTRGDFPVPAFEKSETERHYGQSIKEKDRIEEQMKGSDKIYSVTSTMTREAMLPWMRSDCMKFFRVDIKCLFIIWP